MKKNSFLAYHLSVLICILSLIVGCNQESDNARPQVADINSVGCLIANDFYAVHFSAYLQPSQDAKIDTQKSREALLKPYCQELPGIGKAFFSADLIDRDIRQTPIGIRIVETEPSTNQTAPAAGTKEVRTVLDVAPKLYPRGVVEAQANIDKIGDYELILIIGGEEALSEDDKLHVPFHVGKTMFALSTQMLVLLVIGLLVIIGSVYLIYRYRKQSY